MIRRGQGPARCLRRDGLFRLIAYRLLFANSRSLAGRPRVERAVLVQAQPDQAHAVDHLTRAQALLMACI
ncbi:hypothetical protein KKK_12765 [Pseudomonas putida B6-2]|nr:hypothetical protein KKK_12765 [Pseudomonas putida B6-2]